MKRQMEMNGDIVRGVEMVVFLLVVLTSIVVHGGGEFVLPIA